MVGREQELAQIGEFLAGAPGALLLEGEAGIGKSTLWQAALAAAHSRVVTARPARKEALLSFAVLADILEPLVEEVSADLPALQRAALRHVIVEGAGEADVDARAVAAATRSVLRAAAPLVVAIDDVQWTDAASAAALGYALRRLGQADVHVLLAHRRGEPVAFELDAARLSLGPLSLGALQRLLLTRLELRLPRSALQRLHEISVGNPFYALELARTYTDTDGIVLSKPLHDLLDVRLRGFPPATRRALATLALGGEESRELGPAVEAGVVEPHRHTIAFTHPLLAEAAVDLITPAERREVHAELATTARTAEQRARHRALAATHADEAVAAELELAAEAAVARGAGPGAVDLLELAIRLTPSADAESLVRRRLRRVDLLVVAGEHSRARPELLRLVDELAPGTQRAHAWSLLALGPRDTDELVALMQRAYEETEDDARAIEYGCMLAWSLQFNRCPDAIALAREVLGRAGQVGVLRLRCAALGTLAACLFAAGEDPSSLFGEGLAAGGWDGVVREFNSPWHGLAKLRTRQGRYEEARRIYVDLLARCDERGDEYTRRLIGGDLIAVERGRGDWEAMLAVFEQHNAMRGAEDVGHFRASGLRHRATVLSYLGDVEGTAAAARACLERQAAGVHAYALQAATSVAFVRFSEGRPREALAELEPFLGHLETRQTPGAGSPNTRGLLCELLLAAGERDRAKLVLDDFEQRLTALDVPAAAYAQRCRALLAADCGDLERALELLAEAAPPEPFERARDDLLAGALLRRLRRRGDARARLLAARDVFARLGARLWIERAEEELSRLGGRSPAGAELTATERRVAELVAGGLPNKEVAARLVVTVGTVEAHLSRIYAKLGVRSRSELAGRWPQSVGESPIAEVSADA